MAALASSPSAAATSKGAWFARAASALSAVPLGDAPGELELEPLIAAARVLGDGYAILYGDGGRVSKLLRGDLDSQTLALEEAVARVPPARSAAPLMLRTSIDAVALASDGSSPASPLRGDGASPRNADCASPAPPPISGVLRTPPAHDVAFPAAPATLAALTTHELAIAGGPASARTKGAPGIHAGLWLMRTLVFIQRLLTRLADDMNMSIARAGAVSKGGGLRAWQPLGEPEADPLFRSQDTYAEVLRPYHTSAMSWVVRIALAWAPSRAAAVASTGFSAAAAREGCALVAAALEPITRALVSHYERIECSWPDKTSAVPGGW